MICRELFKHQNKLYIIEKTVNEKRLKPEFVDDVKKYWNCDYVVKQINNQTNEIVYIFLKEISDVEIIEETVT